MEMGDGEVEQSFVSLRLDIELKFSSVSRDFETLRVMFSECSDLDFRSVYRWDINTPESIGFRTFCERGCICEHPLKLHLTSRPPLLDPCKYSAPARNSTK